MAKIDGGIARQLFGELHQLRETLTPKIRDLIEAATTSGLTVARSTVDTVLDTLEQRTQQLVSIVDDNSPSDVKPGQR